MIALGFAAAAALGAVMRWRISEYNHAGLPIATLAINSVAAFALGLAVGSSAATLTIVGVGYLGAFSTFSTIMKESHELAAAAPERAIAYMTLTIIVGVGAARLGLALG